MCFLVRCVLHPLPLPLSSCLGCIPPLIGLPSLRFYAVGSSLFLLSVCFCLCSIATMSFAGYFLSVLFCMLSMLISDSRFDLVWFRLSCDHGWIRSGSVNVRKQQNSNNNNVPYVRGLLAHGFQNSLLRFLILLFKMRSGLKSHRMETWTLDKKTVPVYFTISLFFYRQLMQEKTLTTVSPVANYRRLI